MRRGGGQNNAQRPQGPGGYHYYNEPPPAFSAPPPPPPPPFSSTPSARPQLPPPPPPPPPPPVPDYHLYVKPEKVPMESLQYVYDPYGGLPRREDLDPYNTSQPPPRPTHNNDLQPTYRSFRDVILSMQSWGVHYPEPTDTSIKRWARRALRADTRAQALREQETARDAPPPAATSSPLHHESPRAEEEEEGENASGDDSTAPPQNVTHTDTITAHFSPITAVQHRTHSPPTS